MNYEHAMLGTQYAFTGEALRIVERMFDSPWDCEVRRVRETWFWSLQ